MKTKIIYGILLFFVGVAMVACGDKGSSSPSTPNNQVPAIPVTGGVFDPTNSQCQSTNCTYSGLIQISNPTNFAMMGTVPQYKTTNGATFDIDGSDLSSPRDFIKALFGNMTLGVVFDTHGNIDYGINTGVNVDNQNNRRALPGVNSTVTCALQISGNSIVGTYTHRHGFIQSFNAQAIQTTDGSLVYVDEPNNIAFFTSVNTSGRVTSMGVGVHTAQGIGSAGLFKIQNVY